MGPTSHMYRRKNKQRVMGNSIMKETYGVLGSMWMLSGACGYGSACVHDKAATLTNQTFSYRLTEP